MPPTTQRLQEWISDHNIVMGGCFRFPSTDDSLLVQDQQYLLISLKTNRNRIRKKPWNIWARIVLLHKGNPGLPRECGIVAPCFHHAEWAWVRFLTGVLAGWESSCDWTFNMWGRCFERQYGGGEGSDHVSVAQFNYMFFPNHSRVLRSSGMERHEESQYVVCW